MPKYVWGKVERVGGVYLPTLRREFECCGRKYSLEIAPARITDGDTEIECFPSKREEMVEDALRKMMAEGQGIFLDGEAGISFTRYQLQKELKNTGNSYSTQQIKQALTILARTSIELKSEDAEIEIYFSPIETLGFKGKNDEKQTFVRFSPLVTRSIQERSFRLINYEQVMSYKSVIARLLHKPALAAMKRLLRWIHRRGKCPLYSRRVWKATENSISVRLEHSKRRTAKFPLSQKKFGN